MVPTSTKTAGATGSAAEPEPPALWNYEVYGLRLESDVAIAGLDALPPAGSPDVTLTTGALHPDIAASLERLSGSAENNDQDSVVIFASEAGHGVVYRDGTRFFIHAGASRIDAAWPAESSVEDMATYLLGSLLSYVLRLRGVLCLHGSAILIERQAVVLVAPHGGGKSTTAARFSDRAAPVMSDDVVPIRWHEGIPLALAGYPRLRLWEETAIALYGHAVALPRLTATWPKRYLDLQTAPRVFARGAHPIGAIFILGSRIAGMPVVDRLHGHDAAIQLVANTSMGSHLDPGARVRELENIVDLTERIPVYLARASDDLRRLDEFCDLIRAVSVEGL